MPLVTAVVHLGALIVYDFDHPGASTDFIFSIMLSSKYQFCSQILNFLAVVCVIEVFRFNLCFHAMSAESQNI